jgi:electron transfer flavoprotein beta subunit
VDIVVIVKRIDTSDSSPTGKAMDIGDKTALDLAITLREKHGFGNSRVSVLCIAPVDAAEVIRESYAVGADIGYLLSDPMFESIDVNGLVGLLQSAVNKLGKCDLVIMASHTGDDITIDVGNKLANSLGFKHVKNIEKFEAAHGNRITTISKNEERSIVEVPALINLVCDSEQKVHNAMRIMKAFKKDVKIWTSKDLNPDHRKHQGHSVAAIKKKVMHSEPRKSQP